jgi:hypothetical protein
MEMSPIGIVVLVAIGGFVVWKMFFNKEESAPVVAKAPAPAPAVKKAEPVAKVVAEDVVKLPTKTVLSKMTKKEIDNLAQVDFGVTLDARVTKDKMISALQKEVKAQKK